MSARFSAGASRPGPAARSRTSMLRACRRLSRGAMNWPSATVASGCGRPRRYAGSPRKAARSTAQTGNAIECRCEIGRQEGAQPTAAQDCIRSPRMRCRQLCYAWWKAGARMSDHTIEKLVTNAIHTAFIKYPEGDGGSNLDYEWIAPEQSKHVTKAILLELAANGYQIVKKA